MAKKTVKKTAKQKAKEKAIENQENKFQKITDEVIKMLETCEGTFELPWHNLAGTGIPINIVSKKPYRGMNRFWLTLASMRLNNCHFASYKQWQEKGRQVKKGELGFEIVYYKPTTWKVKNEAGEEEEKSTALLRFSTVFNETQLENYEAPKEEKRESVVEQIWRVDEVIDCLKPVIEEGASGAFYRPSEDKIYLPPIEMFKSTEQHYATLLHELTHWTGHKTRCDRPLRNNFGSKEYAKEELIAELGSSFLCQDLGVSNYLRPDHVHYLKSWLGALRDDNRFIFRAAAKAQKAVEWIHENVDTGSAEGHSPFISQDWNGIAERMEDEQQELQVA